MAWKVSASHPLHANLQPSVGEVVLARVLDDPHAAHIRAAALRVARHLQCMCMHVHFCTCLLQRSEPTLMEDTY